MMSEKDVYKKHPFINMLIRIPVNAQLTTSKFKIVMCHFLRL